MSFIAVLLKLNDVFQFIVFLLAFKLWICFTHVKHLSQHASLSFPLIYFYKHELVNFYRFLSWKSCGGFWCKTLVFRMFRFYCPVSLHFRDYRGLIFVRQIEAEKFAHPYTIYISVFFCIHTYLTQTQNNEPNQRSCASAFYGEIKMALKCVQLEWKLAVWLLIIPIFQIIVILSNRIAMAFCSKAMDFTAFNVRKMPRHANVLRLKCNLP